MNTPEGETAAFQPEGCMQPAPHPAFDEFENEFMANFWADRELRSTQFLAVMRRGAELAALEAEPQAQLEITTLASMLGWRLRALPGESLPKGMCYVESKKEPYPIRDPTFFKHFKEGHLNELEGEIAKAAHLDFGTLQKKARMALGETGMLRAALDTHPLVDFMRSFDKTGRQQSDRPLTPQERLIQTNILERETRSQFGIPDDRSINSYHNARIKMRSAQHRIEETRLPFKSRSNDGTYHEDESQQAIINGLPGLEEFIENITQERFQRDWRMDVRPGMEGRAIKKVSEHLEVGKDMEEARDECLLEAFMDFRSSFNTGSKLLDALAGELLWTLHYNDMLLNRDDPPASVGEAIELILNEYADGKFNGDCQFDEDFRPYTVHPYDEYVRRVIRPPGKIISKATRDIHANGRNYKRTRAPIKPKSVESTMAYKSLVSKQELTDQRVIATVYSHADISGHLVASRSYNNGNVNPSPEGPADVVIENHTPDQVVNIIGYTFTGQELTAEGSVLSFFRKLESNPYQECPVVIPPPSQAKLAEWFDNMGATVIAKKMKQIDSMSVTGLSHMIRDLSDYYIPEAGDSNNLMKVSQDAPDARVSAGRLQVQCLEAAAVFCEAVNMALGEDTARCISGEVISKNGRSQQVTNIGHAQVIMQIAGQQYILDPAPHLKGSSEAVDEVSEVTFPDSADSLMELLLSSPGFGRNSEDFLSLLRHPDAYGLDFEEFDRDLLDEEIQGPVYKPPDEALPIPEVTAMEIKEQLMMQLVGALGVRSSQEVYQQIFPRSSRANARAAERLRRIDPVIRTLVMLDQDGSNVLGLADYLEKYGEIYTAARKRRQQMPFYAQNTISLLQHAVQRIMTADLT